jgi:glucose-1-phosphate cytidylyltransferase
MKAVILAGGLGTRLSEETTLKPKPMVEVGGKPLLWHIIKQYSHYGINDFIICLGYKGHIIKHFFAHYYLLMSDVTFDMTDNSATFHRNVAEPWRVTLVDTGEESMTGGRVRRIRDYIKDDDCFCLTYGDGLSNINIAESIAFHRNHGKLATVTAVQTAGSYGVLDLQGEKVGAFREKPAGDSAYINAGFFVLSPRVIDYIDGDDTVWEKKPLEMLASRGELMAYRHSGFWHCVDTLRDRTQAEALWDSGKAPWKLW